MTRGDFLSGRAVRVALVLMLVAVAVGLAIPPARAANGRLLRVPQDYPSVGAAVAAAHPYDFVLVGPGTYREAVHVTTPHLTIRGVDRNRVIFDGGGSFDSAIWVDGANDVELDNMTAHGYKSNGFWWDKVTGFRGLFLTAYEEGSYGIYAFRSTVGEFGYSYAASSGDSGFYIGACFDCKSVIHDVHSQNNGLGYSGTNSGGVVIKDSEWDNNLIGLIPNTLPTEDDGPQGGKVGDTITNNYVHDNNNGSAPSTFSLAGPLKSTLGYGIEIGGGWNNLIIRNRVVNHKHSGIALHWLQDPTVGNQVEYNDISRSTEADVAWDGIGANNCFQGNTDGGKPASTDPPTLETTNSCGLASAPVGGDPVAGIRVAMSAAGLGETKNPAGQPKPGPQSVMADPCSGAPAGCGAQAAAAAAQPAYTSAPPNQSTPSATGYAPIQSLASVAQGLQQTPTQADVRRAMQEALANLQRANIAVNVAPAPPDINGYLATAMGVAALFLLIGAGLGFWRHTWIPLHAASFPSSAAPPPPEPTPPPRPRRPRTPKS
jgi:hypothetical protein